MPTASAAATSYDRVPYKSHPFRQSHPDRLAVIATLHGMTPPPIERARVLELGCASGGNLLPIADQFPEGTFLGLDLSSRQIQDGQRLIEQAGLKNVELRHQDILAFDAPPESFDYILCHAVVAGLPTEPLRPTAGLPNGASGPNEETFGQGTVALSGDRPQQEDRRLNEFYWPIEWHKRIARNPHDNDTWLVGPHTIIANGEPPEPFAPNTKMSCLMLLANPSEFGRWTRPSVARSGDRPQQEEVVFYDVFGLYTEERDLELREGLPELLNRFQDRFISKVLDPQRPNVAL